MFIVQLIGWGVVAFVVAFVLYKYVYLKYKSALPDSVEKVADAASNKLVQVTAWGALEVLPRTRFLPAAHGPLAAPQLP